MSLRALVAAACALGAPCSAARAQAVHAHEREVAGALARVELVAADAEAAEQAAELAFAELAGPARAGAACDRALAALAERGLDAACVRFGGCLAAGAPPPDAPGWIAQVGFGTPGHALLAMPIARAGLAADARAGEPLRVTVLARGGAEEAQRLADDVHRLGRRAGRAHVARAEGARLFLEDPRFRPLFDGRSLAGWTTTGGPYDGAARWSAEGGAIVGRPGEDGAGGLLYTEELFTSFVVEMEVDVDQPFDSGVFVRMAPGARGAQVTLDNRPDGEVGAIYSDGFLAHNPEGRARFAQGRWNHLEVRVTGFDLRVQAWLEGEPLADHALAPGTPGFARAGRIGLQVHAVEPGEAADRPRVRFRNVRVRPLPVLGDQPLAADDGWRDLFAGGLAAFELTGDLEGAAVRDGELALPARAEGHLATVEDFQDLELALEFQLARGANGGVFLRAARDGGDPAYSGCEVQLIDDAGWEELTGTPLAAWQRTASLYGAVPAGDTLLLPPGEWNALELAYVGSRLAVALNGRLCYDVDVLALEPDQGPRFAERARAGFIGLQAHAPATLEGDVGLRFRGFRVRRR